MEYVVAGAVMLLAVFAAILAYMSISIRSLEPKPADAERSDCSREGKVSASAAAFSSAVRKLTAKQWFLIAAAAALTGAAALRLGILQVQPLAAGRLLVTALVLIPVMIIDWSSHRIPNSLVLTMLLAGTVFLVLEYLFQRSSFSAQLISSCIGLFGCLVLFYVMARLTKDGIGMGDVKLITALGWIVGFVVTLTATLFSLIACSAVAVVLLLGKKKNASDHIPFGPFVFFGYIFTLLICNI